MRSLCAIVLFVCLPVIAGAQPWADDFDSYPLGPIGYQGGWQEWLGGPGTATVTNSVARSMPNSLQISDPDDTVHPFFGATSGVWVFTAWVYVGDPSGGHYFILLNRFPDANFSLQLLFENSVVYCDGCRDPGNIVPIVHNQWVPLEITIDLDADRQTVYYNDTVVVDTSWTEAIIGQSGDLNIAAVDLFTGSNVFYDDMSLELRGPASVSDGPMLTPSTWGEIKAQGTR